MKKYTSVASLAMKLTWLRTVVVFAAVGVIEFLVARSWILPNGVALATSMGIEDVLDTVMHYGCLGFFVLLLALTFSGGEFKRSRFCYTINRLGISENRVTALFGLVFAGYFFLYLVWQLAIVLGLFRWYESIYAPGPNALMLAAWRSDWFHLLLPLQETSGYIRNAVLCASFGACAAMGAHWMRHKKNYIPVFIPPAVAALWMGNVTPGMLGADLFLTIFLLAFTAICALTLRGGNKDEDLL